MSVVETRYGRSTAKVRQEEIIDAAIDVFGRLGFRQGSVRDVAAAVGLTVQGVLYYFPTKEQLLMATLEHRAELRRSRTDVIQRERGVVAMMRFQLEAGLAKPGMMRLFITLAAEATDPDHPAHHYFLDRYQRAHDHLRAGLAADIEAGRRPRTVDPADAAVRLIALCDGLQLQYLLRPGFDLLAAYDRNTADLLLP
jgi:AcrR family transcriptional regulator